MSHLVPRVDSLLHLRFHSQPELGPLGQTTLEIVAQTPPQRVIRAFPLPDGSALAHLHNISGGVLGGDALALRVSVDANARAQLTTPGATRLYRHRPGLPDTCQQTQVEIGPGGLLEYLPDPLIPFAGARYRQSTRIHLGPDAGLFWWETLAPGREAHNERFAYDQLEMTLEIYADDHHPIALERYQLRPRETPLPSLARLGTYLYHITFYICRTGLPESDWLALEGELTSIAQEFTQPGVSLWGASALRSDGVVVRGLSASHRSLPAQLTRFWQAAKYKLYGVNAIPPRKNY